MKPAATPGPTPGLLIDLGGRGRFTPGEAVEVAAGWELPTAPGELVLELLWSTSGRGRTNAAAARRMVMTAAEAAGAEVVRWSMPAGPWTHAGTLVSLDWCVRLSVPGERRVEVPVVLAPAGRPA